MLGKYIVVEGPIGVGKSGLVSALQTKLNAKVLNDAANPFLNTFYQDMEKNAFQVQTFFLLSRFAQQREISQGDLFSNAIICDYLLQKDRLFASLTLDMTEYALYEKIYGLLSGTLIQPDVIIYLHTDVDTLMNRIAKRNNDLSLLLPRKYLADVVQAYQTFFVHYTAAPVIVCNVTKGDLEQDQRKLDMLLEKIQDVKTGTHYLNPQEN